MIYVLTICLCVVSCLGSRIPNYAANNERIVGGKDTSIERHPYQVSLVDEDKHRCGGSLIAENWVLTAGHCIHPAWTYQGIRVGSTTVGKGGTLYKVKNQYIHPNKSSLDYDFGLIELIKPVTLSDKVQVVKLADDAEELKDGTMLDMTGWGDTKGQYTEVLQLVSIPTVNQEKCNVDYDGDITDRMFCAGVEGKGSCNGDSGGPLVANGKQYGIVSWSIGCALPELPGVYAKISNQRKWIKEVSGV